MKNIWKQWVIAAMLLSGFLSGPLAAQEISGNGLMSERLAIRSIETLITDALAHSPLLEAQELNVDIIHQKIKILNREWAQYLAVTGTYQFGNIRYLDNLDAGGVIDYRAITRENNFYSAGISLRVPISDFMTKNSRRSILEDQLKQEKLLRQDKEMKLRELVIRQYQELQLQMQMLEVKAKGLDFHTVNATMAEKYFREGQMGMDEYTSAVVKKNQAEEVVIEARVKMQLAYQILKEIVGAEVKAINTESKHNSN